MQNDFTKRVIILILATVLGLSVSLAGGNGGAQFANVPVFLICGGLAFIINWLAFIPANNAQSEKYYDLVGGSTYVAVILTALALTPELTVRAKLAAVMVIVWAVRLGSFLFIRIRKNGHDSRFDDIKIAPMRFLTAWTLQGLWVLLTAACALAIITGGDDRQIGLVGIIGFLIWLLGFILEIIADAQKRVFKRNPDNQGRFINSGLWAWSQHPNYFGEIVLWFGMAVLAIPVLENWQWITLISPVFVVLLLTKGSGIPMLQEKANKRWGNEEVYQRYIQTTPLLIPLPPKR